MSDLYKYLRKTVCCICLKLFKNNTIVSFNAPCWVHPLCYNCFQRNGCYANCPICRAKYTGSSLHIKINPWPPSEEVGRPPIVYVRVPKELLGHGAPCCKYGYKAGDLVVGRICLVSRHHFMHSWCFLMTWLDVADDKKSISVSQRRINCFACKEVFDDSKDFYTHELEEYGGGTLLGHFSGEYNFNFDPRNYNRAEGDYIVDDDDDDDDEEEEEEEEDNRGDGDNDEDNEDEEGDDDNAEENEDEEDEDYSGGYEYEYDNEYYDEEQADIDPNDEYYGGYTSEEDDDDHSDED